MMIWFTRESWRYMSGRRHPLRFLAGYPRALFRWLVLP